jgi:hypothetical protein
MAISTTEITTELLLLDARLEECKRFAEKLQRVGRLNGVTLVHYENRCQAIEVERNRLTKLLHKRIDQDIAAARELKKNY